jgi:D-alanyl-D-alanine endopeptidase (penicillin-binding protein 7)
VATRARQLVESLPRLKAGEHGLLVPDVRAAAAIVYDPETKEVLWEENSLEERSIASITKVMTAVVFLEDDPDLSEVVTVSRTDVSRASTTFLRRFDKVTTGDLLHLALIASDNAAARALARVSRHGAARFIERMNQKAIDLGLATTHYVDSSGLLSANVSSAFEMAQLITFAASDERISSIMRMPEHTIRTANPKPRTIRFRNTNRLLDGQDVDVLGGKTGFIRKAGYCLAAVLQLPEGGPQVAVVVLGAGSNAGRFLEVRNLFDWLAIQTSALFMGAVGTPALPGLPSAAQ